MNIVPFNNGIVAAVASGVLIRAVRSNGRESEMSRNFFSYMLMMMVMMMMF
ncbi:hypothetical protein [Nocardia sp. NPDC003963]